MKLLLPHSLQESIFYTRRTLFASTTVAIIGLFFLLWKIVTLFPGPSNLEASFLTSYGDLGSLGNDPTHWLYRLVVGGLDAIFNDIVLAGRLGSVVFGVTSVALLYLLLRSWYRHRQALIGSGFFILSSWVFGFFRIATGEIVTIPLLILLLLSVTKISQDISLKWVITLLATLLTGLYIPGFLYIAIPMLIISVVLAFKQGASITRQHIAAAVGAIIIGTIPLVLASRNDTSVMSNLLLLNSLPEANELLGAIIYPLSYVFISAAENPNIHLRDLPALDLFGVIVTLVGTYAYIRDYKSSRSKLLLAMVAGIVVSYVLRREDTVASLMIAPVYIAAATGIKTIYELWADSFPRNQLARGIIIMPLTVIMLTSLNYQYQRYFVASANDAQIIEAHNEVYSRLEESLDSASIPIKCSQDEETVCELYAQENQVELLSIDELIPSTQFVATQTSLDEISEETLRQLADEDLFSVNTVNSLIDDDSVLFRVYTPK